MESLQFILLLLLAEEPTNYEIGFCRLQFPLSITETIGNKVEVYGRLYVAGVTDLTGESDPVAGLIGYVGYGPDGSDPAGNGAWVWTTGEHNAGYNPGSPGYEANNDEYQSTLTVPGPADDYDFAFRFSGDGGATFTWCDGDNEGSTNGYSAEEAGQMTSQN